VRGFAVRPVFNCLHATWLEYERDYARYFAAAMVYYALVSLVPLILLILGALGLLLRRSELAAAAEAQVLQTVEASLGAPLRVTLGGVLQSLERGSTIAVAVSLIGLLLTGAKLFHHLRMTFRAIWKHAPLASGPARKALRATLFEAMFAFLLLLVTSGLLLIALLLMAALQWLHARSGSIPFLRQPAAWLLAIAGPLIFTSLTFALLFKALPPVRLSWRQVWPSSALCAAAWIVGAEILTSYGAYVGENLGAYGAIGGLLILMLWINVTSQMLFFGAELCKVIASRAPATAGGEARAAHRRRALK
jgi:membrane protein